jgi:phosphoglycolate phosphatase
MFRNVIFDWSGTLCDDLGPVLETVNAVLRHCGAPEVDRDGFLRDFRLPFGDYYREILPDKTHDELEALYRHYYPMSRRPVAAIPHAAGFVGALRAAGRSCFLLSAVTPGHWREQAEAIGLADAFQGIRLGVRDKRGVLPRWLEAERWDPEETCFIGDMVHDVEAARAAGVTAIAVLTGYDSAAKLAASGPDLIVPDLDALARWFRRAEARATAAE